MVPGKTSCPVTNRPMRATFIMAKSLMVKAQELLMVFHITFVAVVVNITVCSNATNHQRDATRYA